MEIFPDPENPRTNIVEVFNAGDHANFFCIVKSTPIEDEQDHPLYDKLVPIYNMALRLAQLKKINYKRIIYNIQDKNFTIEQESGRTLVITGNDLPRIVGSQPGSSQRKKRSNTSMSQVSH